MKERCKQAVPTNPLPPQAPPNLPPPTVSLGANPQRPPLKKKERERTKTPNHRPPPPKTTWPLASRELGLLAASMFSSADRKCRASWEVPSGLGETAAGFRVVGWVGWAVFDVLFCGNHPDRNWHKHVCTYFDFPNRKLISIERPSWVSWSYPSLSWL